jgi:2-polyprenyl-3-methyl-5-hydroxy-6-metoxy-1,4-benzoquinol methylase
MTAPTSPPPEQRAEAWGSLAEAYDVFAESVTRLFAEDAARLVRLGRGSRVIDVAAGTGAFTLAAARRGANVLATDIWPGADQSHPRPAGA